jgi:hypothetical protein
MEKLALPIKWSAGKNFLKGKWDSKREKDLYFSFLTSLGLGAGGLHL